DNANLTFSIGSTPAHGSLGPVSPASCTTLPNTTTTPGGSCTATVTYTPAANYNGPDSFTFKVNDGALDSTLASVSITVTAVNDAPTAASQSVSTNEDTALPITLSGADIDSPSLTFSVGSGPSHGTLSTITGTSCSSAPNGTGTPGSNCTATV